MKEAKASTTITQADRDEIDRLIYKRDRLYFMDEVAEELAAQLREERQRGDSLHASLCKLSNELGNPALISGVSLEDALVDYAVSRLREAKEALGKAEWCLDDTAREMDIRLAALRAELEEAKRKGDDLRRAVGIIHGIAKGILICRDCGSIPAQDSKCWDFLREALESTARLVTNDNAKGSEQKGGEFWTDPIPKCDGREGGKA